MDDYMNGIPAIADQRLSLADRKFPGMVFAYAFLTPRSFECGRCRDEIVLFDLIPREEAPRMLPCGAQPAPVAVMPGHILDSCFQIYSYIVFL